MLLEYYDYLCRRFSSTGVLAHLVRALDWQSKGDRFESDILHTTKIMEFFSGADFLHPDLTQDILFFRTPSGYCMVTQCSAPPWVMRTRQSMPMISRLGKAFCNCFSATSSLSLL